ncbi:TPA: hypothetical protein EYN98_26160 [Candidatus Poribacteria bacterium]|nr:hypothetical protein [Candidatus Poribacteria bacterium]
MPWWSVAIVAFLIGFWKPINGWKTFGSGFVGVGLLWLIVAGYLHYRSNGMLTIKVGQLIHLPSSTLMLILTAVFGGLVGGMAAVTGFHLRLLLSGEQNSKK